MKNNLNRCKLYIGCLLVIVWAGFFTFYGIHKKSVRRECVLCLDSVFFQTMEERVKTIANRGAIRMSRSGRRQPTVNQVSFSTEQGEQKFVIDSLRDSKNVTWDSYKRFLYSVSFREDSFQLDSFVQDCQQRLARCGIQSDLFFRFEDRQKHIQQAGDSTLRYDGYLVYDHVMGYGNEYRLTCRGKLPFLFSSAARWGLVACVVGSMALLWVCLCRNKRSKAQRASKGPWLVKVEGKDMYVFKDVLVFEVPNGIFHWKGSEALLFHLSHIQNKLFCKFLQAPGHTVTTDELWTDVWKQERDRSVVSTAVARLKDDLSKTGILEIVSVKRGVYRLKPKEPTGCDGKMTGL